MREFEKNHVNIVFKLPLIIIAMVKIVLKE